MQLRVKNQPVAIANTPNWLYAETLDLGDGLTALFTYRSVELRDTDNPMAPIRAVMDEAGEVHLAAVFQVEDEMMMFGRAQMTLHAVCAPGKSFHESDLRLVTGSYTERVRELM